ncbi:MAG: hypothetical protein OXI39_14305 [Gemmatimonadota bacterium]|uniref:hypothetical protein n=1 Tax=Candidatus Palauibacter scopulicola TaxID=3056741 RepID=UPI00238314D4|nr:hypothetical protein [Candidatus Palauibacter scopulicola]MDE2664158.1 hypothetical protein [Candidatus Palauibacter scopulicola]
MKLRGLAVLTAAMASVMSCGGGATGPRGSLCDTRHGTEVCVDRPEYRSGEAIVITTRNVSNGSIFKDCGTTAVPAPDSEDEFRPAYNPRRRCGATVTRTEIVERMVRLEPGASTRETLRLGYSPQDFFHVTVWLLTLDGELAFDTPATSGVFVIFPGANN